MTAHAAMENTFFEDFSVQKMLTIIVFEIPRLEKNHFFKKNYQKNRHNMSLNYCVFVQFVKN